MKDCVKMTSNKRVNVLRDCVKMASFTRINEGLG